MNPALIAAMQFNMQTARQKKKKAQEQQPEPLKPPSCVFCNKALEEQDKEWGYCKYSECNHKLEDHG